MKKTIGRQKTAKWRKHIVLKWDEERGFSVTVGLQVHASPEPIPSNVILLPNVASAQLPRAAEG